MPSHCLIDRATALVNAVSMERHENLSAVVQQIRTAMNSRGMLHSSLHVNEVNQACASELRNMGSLIWDNMKRAHESCGSKASDDLLGLFRMLLLAEKAKLEQLQERAIGTTARQLQNKALIPMQGVSETCDDLLRQYKVEIEIYISNLQGGAGANLVDMLRNRFMNNWVIAVGVTVVTAIVFIAAFTDAIRRLSGFVKGVFGDG